MYHSTDPATTRPNTNEYVSMMTDRMRNSYEIVREFSGQAAMRMKIKYDRGVKPAAALKAGQRVLYYYPRRYTRKSPKWQSVYVGPFRVVKQIDDHRVVIQRYKNTVPIVVGRSKLKIVPEGMDFEEVDKWAENRNHDRTKQSRYRNKMKTPPKGEIYVRDRNADTVGEDVRGVVGEGERRRRSKPTYLNDYVTSRAVFAIGSVRTMENRKKNSRNPMLKPEQCKCGSRFTSLRGLRRHKKEFCYFTSNSLGVSKETRHRSTGRSKVSSAKPAASDQRRSIDNVELDDWRAWLAARPTPRTSEVASFLADRTDDIPMPVRSHVFQWLADSITAAYELGRSVVDSGQRATQDEASTSSIAIAGDVRPAKRVRYIQKVGTSDEVAARSSRDVEVDDGEGGVPKRDIVGEVVGIVMLNCNGDDPSQTAGPAHALDGQIQTALESMLAADTGGASTSTNMEADGVGSESPNCAVPGDGDIAAWLEAVDGLGGAAIADIHEDDIGTVGMINREEANNPLASDRDDDTIKNQGHDGINCTAIDRSEGVPVDDFVAMLNSVGGAEGTFTTISAPPSTERSDDDSGDGGGRPSVSDVAADGLHAVGDIGDNIDRKGLRKPEQKETPRAAWPDPRLGGDYTTSAELSGDVGTGCTLKLDPVCPTAEDIATGKPVRLGDGSWLGLREEVELCRHMFMQIENVQLLKIEEELSTQGFCDQAPTVERVARLILTAFLTEASMRQLLWVRWKDMH